MKLESARFQQARLSEHFGFFNDLSGVSIATSGVPVSQGAHDTDYVVVDLDARHTGFQLEPLPKALTKRDLHHEFIDVTPDSSVLPTSFLINSDTIHTTLSKLNAIGFPSFHAAYDRQFNRSFVDPALTVYPSTSDGLGAAFCINEIPVSHYFADTITLSPGDVGDHAVEAPALLTLGGSSGASKVASLGSKVVAIGMARATARNDYHLVLHTSTTVSKDDLLADFDESLRAEIDIRVVGPVKLQAGTLPMRAHVRPPRPGASIGHERGTAGSLGAFVSRDQTVFALSCGHVLAAGRHPRPRDPVLQPGPNDGGRAWPPIGTLSQYEVLRREFANAHDIAIAEMSAPHAHDTRMLVLDRSMSDVAFEGDPEGVNVSKVGRTTGHTSGVIGQAGIVARLDFDGQQLLFLNQVAIEPDVRPFSDGGDSGSVIWESDSGKPLGVVIGGSDEVTYGSLIAPYLATYNLQLVS